MVTLNAARGILSIPENRRDAQVSRPAFEPVVLKGLQSNRASVDAR